MSHTLPGPWVSPGGDVHLEVCFHRDFTPHTAEVVVLGFCHGSSGYYRLPECRSALLKATRIPASTPTGRSLRDWLAGLPRLPSSSSSFLPSEQEEPDPSCQAASCQAATAHTKTII